MRKPILLAFGLLVLSLSLAFAQPAIRTDRGVLNASSYQADIARGSWMVIFGTNMGPASLSAYGGALPFPTSLSGTSVTATPAAGGTAVTCRMYYTSGNQVAALLPSSAPAGDYDVKVTYNNATSAGYRIKVVDRNFGFATSTSNGSGVPQATNASLNGGVSLVRFTSGSISFNGRTWPYRPAYPGETLVLWGTGLGADSQSDENGGTSGDQTAAANVKVVVGGIEVTPAYAGRSSGSPGLDQINFVLPANVPRSCTTSIQVIAGGRWSNLGTLPTANGGEQFCQHPFLTQDQLRTLDAGGTVVIGSFTLQKSSTTISLLGQSFETSSESAGGSFSKYTGDQLTTIGGLSVAQIGSCYATRVRGTATDALQGPVSFAADAGNPLLLNGPNASNKQLTRLSGNVYNADLYSSGVGGFGGSGTPTLSGGTYTLSGPGGTEIAAFSNAQSPFPAAFKWENQAAISTITRNQSLLIQWSGGGTETGATVNIVGLSGSQVPGGSPDNPIYDIGLFVCTAPASAQTFTVPASVTSYLSPVAAGSTTGIGLLAVSADNTRPFTANLVGGGSVPSEFGYSWTYSKTVAVQ